MKFLSPLGEGVLVKRYKRFMADIKLPDGSETTIHCPNTGSMATCGQPGDTILYSDSMNPARKLQWTWELTKTAKGYVGVNTSRTNRLVEEAFENQLIPSLSQFSELKREVKYGASRIDFCLIFDEKQCWIEVKNATLLHAGNVVFPDAVTSRGLKHLVELQEIKKAGHRAVLFFVVNRSEGEKFSIADHIDGVYAKELKKAMKNGVEVMAWRTHADHQSIELFEEVAVDL
ncbi:MAG: DNA/RNA nuclease SfsA [Oligoflexales bacterium]